MKFTNEDLKKLDAHQILLIVNFAALVSYCNPDWNGVFNCYLEEANLLSEAKLKLDLSDDDIDFLHHFFLENDHY